MDTISDDLLVYEHEPLAAHHIRLLSLLPSDNATRPFRANITVADLSTKPDYEALSYAWGEPDLTDKVLVSNRLIRITTNLAEALAHLRLGSEPRNLWIDQICIDQDKNKERSQQVRQMGNIYRQARNVLVWLGKETEKTTAFFGAIPTLLNSKEKMMLFPRQSSSAEEFKGHTTKYLEASSAMAKGIRDVLECPWFRRLWPVQEVALSSSTLIICGSSGSTWEELVASLSASPVDISKWPEASIVAVVERYRTSILNGTQISLATLLSHSSSLTSSKPHDHVYATLGLASPLARELLPVDYDVPAWALFLSAAMAAIYESRTLEVLSACQLPNRRLTLPSWVPSFDRRSRCYTRFGTSTQFHASGSRKTDLKVSTDGMVHGVLHVEGTIVDSDLDCVGLLSDSPSGKERFVHWCDWAFGKCASHAFAALLARALVADTEQFENHIVDFAVWLQLAWPGIVAKYLPPKTEHSVRQNSDCAQNRAYLQSLSPGRPGALQAQQTPEGAIFGLKVDGFTTGQLRLLGGGPTNKMKALKYTATRYSAYMGAVCAGRRLGITSKGLPGLFPVDTAPGDIVCILFGASVPFVLRKVGEYYIVIGECYVQGIMYGEALEDPEVNVTKFALR